MSNNNNKKTQKKQNSKQLSFRLNAKIVSLHFADFLWVLIMLIIISMVACFIYIEATIYATVKEFDSSSPGSVLYDSRAEKKPIPLGNTNVTYTDIKPEGMPISNFIVKRLPPETLNARRSFSHNNSALSFKSTVRSIEYNVALPLTDDNEENATNEASPVTYQVISVNVGEYIYYFSVILIIILGIMLFGLFVTGLRTRKAVKKTLEPLSNLRAATEAFAGSTKSGNGAYSEDALRNLAGTLNEINASHLDQRIPSEIIASELRPLASAINEMMDRIDEAYSSQIRFVSDASHELRTPIAVIQGYANLLLRWGTKDPQTLQESVEAIKSEADSMKQMVNQLLFLARGDTQSMKLKFAPLDLSKLAREVIKEEMMIDQAHVYESKIADDVCVYADAGLIKQLFRILSDNSIKYTEAGHKISFRLEKTPPEIPESGTLFSQGRAKLIVQDEGVGIPPDILPHIFDRFVRADESRTRNTGGAGLGLSIAKWIVEKNGGYIEVLSNEGIGTRFTVTLPIHRVEESLVK